MTTEMPDRDVPKTMPEILGHALRRMATYFLAVGLLLILARSTQPAPSLPSDIFTTAHGLKILGAGVLCFMLGVVIERVRPRVRA